MYYEWSAIRGWDGHKSSAANSKPSTHYSLKHHRRYSTVAFLQCGIVALCHATLTNLDKVVCPRKKNVKKLFHHEFSATFYFYAAKHVYFHNTFTIIGSGFACTSANSTPTTTNSPSVEEEMH